MPANGILEGIVMLSIRLLIKASLPISSTLAGSEIPAKLLDLKALLSIFFNVGGSVI